MLLSNEEVMCLGAILMRAASMGDGCSDALFNAIWRDLLHDIRPSIYDYVALAIALTKAHKDFEHKGM